MEVAIRIVLQMLTSRRFDGTRYRASQRRQGGGAGLGHRPHRRPNSRTLSHGQRCPESRTFGGSAGSVMARAGVGHQRRQHSTSFNIIHIVIRYVKKGVTSL